MHYVLCRLVTHTYSFFVEFALCSELYVHYYLGLKHVKSVKHCFLGVLFFFSPEKFLEFALFIEIFTGT